MKPCEGKEEGTPKRNVGGRPKKKVKRDCFLMVRLTVSERFLIEEKAKSAGMKPSELFRQAARKAKVIARITPEERHLFHVLTGMANNLNQLAKLAHTEGLLTLHRKCMELLGQIDQVLKKLNSDDRESS